MALLIDGYNLLHVTDLFGHGNEPTALQGSREALLRFLAAAIGPAERKQATIVFDAASAPPGLPKTISHEGITVHFARDYADADTMLEELIESHQAPQSLVVVSSDHRVQRAARRRGAKAVDSERWWAELRTSKLTMPADSPRKPTGDLSEQEVDYWLSKFAEPSADGSTSGVRDSDPARDKTGTPDDQANPFPPGYGEDLLEDPQ